MNWCSFANAGQFRRRLDQPAEQRMVEIFALVPQIAAIVNPEERPEIIKSNGGPRISGTGSCAGQGRRVPAAPAQTLRL